MPPFRRKVRAGCAKLLRCSDPERGDVQKSVFPPPWTGPHQMTMHRPTFCVAMHVAPEIVLSRLLPLWKISLEYRAEHVVGAEHW